MYKPGKKSVRPHSQHPRAAGGAIQTMLSHQTRHIIGRMQGLILVLLCWVVKLYYFLNFQSCKAVYTQLTGVWGERKVKASKKAYSV